MSGVLLQTLTKNPLADSGILGINAGAGLIIAVMVGLLDITNLAVLTLMPFFVMLGSFLTISIVYAVSHRKNQPIQPTRLIISGVGISSLLSGVMVKWQSKWRKLAIAGYHGTSSRDYLGNDYMAQLPPKHDDV